MMIQALGENLQFAYLISQQACCGLKTFVTFGQIFKKNKNTLLLSSCFANFKYDHVLKKPCRWNFFTKYPQRKIKCYDAIYVAKSLGQGHY
jgi:hypothetical protein